MLTESLPISGNTTSPGPPKPSLNHLLGTTFPNFPFAILTSTEIDCFCLFLFFCKWNHTVCNFWDLTFFSLSIVSLTSTQLCNSIAQLYLTLCNPMDCSMPGFPVLHCLLVFAQTHVHSVGDLTDSHLILSHLPPFPALSLSQHQRLFQ